MLFLFLMPIKSSKGETKNKKAATSHKMAKSKIVKWPKVAQKYARFWKGYSKVASRETH